ncbi:MAG: hypothetical protein AB1540_12900 [Bdellovibrionota bacterium]
MRFLSLAILLIAVATAFYFSREEPLKKQEESTNPTSFTNSPTPVASSSEAPVPAISAAPRIQPDSLEVKEDDARNTSEIEEIRQRRLVRLQAAAPAPKLAYSGRLGKPVPPQTLLSDLAPGTLVEVTKPHLLTKGMEREYFIDGKYSGGQYNYNGTPFDPEDLPNRGDHVVCELVTKLGPTEDLKLTPGQILFITGTRVTSNEDGEQIFVLFGTDPVMHSMVCSGPREEAQNTFNVQALSEQFGRWFVVRSGH